MSDADEPREEAPRCPRCGTPLVPAPVPPSAFGVPAEGCIDCSDPAPAQQRPWACPACGGVYLADSACRI